jgi:uncharacterized surface protein with fasciclin (FAS1) repeats
MRRIIMVNKIVISVIWVTFGLAGGLNAGYYAKKDIVDTAASAGFFKTLVAAVKAADLVDTLKGEGPFTVFAPTGAAFA